MHPSYSQSLLYVTLVPNRVVTNYAQARGVSLGSREAGGQGQGHAANLVDSAALLEMQGRHDALISRNIKVSLYFILRFVHLFKKTF